VFENLQGRALAKTMPKEYVKIIEGVYRVANTRVSLDSLVYFFREGMSVKSMVESYPSLSLEEVHGALAFYLANKNEVDAHLADGERVAASEHSRSREVNAEFIAKLRRTHLQKHQR